MNDIRDYDLSDFTPYLLNLAAEQTSLEFQECYKARYGMLRTEWRVLFHLGRYGPMTASTICERARIHKTKVSRAVAALSEKRYLKRHPKDEDRRQEELHLTPTGQSVFEDLYREAREFDGRLMAQFSEQENQVMRQCLARLARL